MTQNNTAVKKLKRAAGRFTTLVRQVMAGKKDSITRETLMVLATYADTEGATFVSLKRLAADLGITYEGVKVRIRKAEQAGYICRVARFDENGRQTSNWLVFTLTGEPLPSKFTDAARLAREDENSPHRAENWGDCPSPTHEEVKAGIAQATALFEQYDRQDAERDRQGTEKRTNDHDDDYQGGGGTKVTPPFNHKKKVRPNGEDSPSEPTPPAKPPESQARTFRGQTPAATQAEALRRAREDRNSIHRAPPSRWWYPRRTRGTYVVQSDRPRDVGDVVSVVRNAAQSFGSSFLESLFGPADATLEAVR